MECSGAYNFEVLLAALYDGDHSVAVEEAERLRGEGVSNADILLHGVESAMSKLDAKCTVEQFNLLEIMLCGRAVMGVIGVLYPAGSEPPSTKGTVVLASLEGDVHDLGKNIVKVVLSAAGYRIVDCGKDCPVDELVETIKLEQPLAVGLSGLLTTIIPQVSKFKDRLLSEGLGHVKIMAGGATLKQSTMERLNVDCLAQTAFDGLHYLEQFAGEKR